MESNVKKEAELYEPMHTWLRYYLIGKYPNCDVKTFDTHSKTLDKYLEQEGVIDQFPQIVGLDIEIDVLGIICKRGRAKLAFIEAKKTQLNLHDLGQLWAYCKLCDPSEAFLMSSAGLGSLSKILKNLNRTDLLNYGDSRFLKQMHVVKWDITKGAPDYFSAIPKIDG